MAVLVWSKSLHRGKTRLLQGYLAHTKHAPPLDHHRSPGIGLVGSYEEAFSYERDTPVLPPSRASVDISQRYHPERATFCRKKISIQELSGNRVYGTNALLLLIKIMLCSERCCHKVSIETPSP